MTYEEVVYCLLGCQEYDFKYMFEDMPYDTFEEAVSRVKDYGGDFDANAILYEALSYGLYECFGDVVDDIDDVFDIYTNFADCGVRVNEDEYHSIPDYEKRSDRFYEMTGIEIMY